MHINTSIQTAVLLVDTTDRPIVSTTVYAATTHKRKAIVFSLKSPSHSLHSTVHSTYHWPLWRLLKCLPLFSGESQKLGSLLFKYSAPLGEPLGLVAFSKAWNQGETKVSIQMLGKV